MQNQLCRLVPPEAGFPLVAEAVRGPAQEAPGRDGFQEVIAQCPAP